MYLATVSSKLISFTIFLQVPGGGDGGNKIKLYVHVVQKPN